MAVFRPRDADAFRAHWKRILADPTCIIRTIECEGRAAGYVGSWLLAGQREVGYWIGKADWGRGIASRALADFLRVVTERPLHAHVALSNAASIRVLEKNGFVKTGEARVPLGPAGPGGDTGEMVDDALMTLFGDR
jgi:RimJ/RimL family protein N-acetyltransferase